MAKERILGISGSLRRNSFNTALLRATIERAGAHGLLVEFSSIELPLYNADLTDPSVLEPVQRFKASIAAVTAVLIATPEYNYGIPGPLKNALDWASRPAYRSVFANKPVGIIGATGSYVGTARAQGQLKQVLLGMASQVFPYPEFLLARASEKFDATGKLTDAPTLEVLDQFLASFAAWIRRVAVPPS
jgi:chromate reductase, NAD(P)H dehydrogenase (quinone)